MLTFMLTKMIFHFHLIFFFLFADKNHNIDIDEDLYHYFNACNVTGLI